MNLRKKTTSIKIDPELWKEVKKYAIDHDTSVTDFIEKILIKEMKK